MVMYQGGGESIQLATHVLSSSIFGERIFPTDFAQLIASLRCLRPTTNIIIRKDETIY